MNEKNTTAQPTEPGLDRRRILQAAAAGAAAAATAVSPAAAQQPAGVMAVATAEDYVRDPTRWGSPEIAAMFPGFAHLDMRTRGATIRLRHGGSGPPLLLVHGNPQNHTCWYRIAGRLAQHYHVILPDLRFIEEHPEMSSAELGKLLGRTRIHKPALKLFDKTVWIWRRIDGLLPWRGLTLVAVARKGGE